MLNARQGCSQSSPDLGLHDFNGVTQGSSDLVIAISADIRRSVEAFEPRIKVTGLRYQPDPDLPLELNFRLDCQVRINHKDERVQIAVAMHGRDGYTRVEVFDRLTDRTRFATEIKFVAGSPSAEAQSGTVLFLESLRFNRGQADGLTVFGYGIDRDTGTTLWRTTDDVGTAGGYLFAAGPQRTYVSLIDTRRQREDV